MGKFKKMKYVIACLVTIIMIFNLFSNSVLALEGVNQDETSQIEEVVENETVNKDEIIKEDKTNDNKQTKSETENKVSEVKSVKKQLTATTGGQNLNYSQWQQKIGRLLSKFYDGNDKWSDMTESPRVRVQDMIEGIDYTRSYHFVDDLSNPSNSWSWSESALGMKNPGFIYERIQGLGAYSSWTKFIRHNILTRIDISVNDASKLDIDSVEIKPTITINYNGNPNTVILREDVNVNREEGETPGVYKYSLSLNMDDLTSRFGNLTSSKYEYGGMLVGQNTKGYVYYYFHEGSLTIKETIEIFGTKTWDDNENKEGKRPESITIRLFADDKEILKTTVNEEDDWSYEFGRFIKYNDDESEIVYTIKEDQVENYRAVYDGFNIKNIFTIAQDKENNTSQVNTITKLNPVVANRKKVNKQKINKVVKTSDHTNVKVYEVTIGLTIVVFILLYFKKIA